MRALLIVLALLSLVAGPAWCDSIAPAKDTFYTSTRYIRALAAAPVQPTP
jgi:hypothetical protein